MDPNTPQSITLSTSDVPVRERLGWLQDTIGREYVKVEVIPPEDGSLFNEMTLQSWERLRLSAVRSNALAIQRLSAEPVAVNQDAYYAVVLLSGRYRLEQQGRRASLEPGDLCLYDATRPHRIHCPESFSKLILAIPRPWLQERVAGIEHCTAVRIAGGSGLGAIAAGFIRSMNGRAGQLQAQERRLLSAQAVGLLGLAAASVRPGRFVPSRQRATTLYLVKDFVETQLDRPGLSARLIAAGVGLSPRYINELFRDEGSSLMRHVWQRRLEKCRDDLADGESSALRVSDIAFRWAFNDLSHFCRVFRKAYGCSPREFRWQAAIRARMSGD